MHSILAKANKVNYDPFPHVVIENALPEDYYYRLKFNRPSYDWIVGDRDPGDNIRLDVGAVQALSRGLHPIWREFLTFHTSPRFWADVFRVFREAIYIFYPQLFWRNLLENPGVRHGTTRPFFLDCNIGLNTPCLDGPSSVRGPHLDNPVELFGGMLYMGTAPGGELIIHQLTQEPEFHGKMEIFPECVEEVGRVPCRDNMAVFFLNTPLSVHSVSERNSPYPRDLVNFIGEYSFPLFGVKR